MVQQPQKTALEQLEYLDSMEGIVRSEPTAPPRSLLWLPQAALVLAYPGWPAGVVGIVASRLVELYGKPTVLIASPSPDAPPGEAGRGSARSVAGVDLTARLKASIKPEGIEVAAAQAPAGEHAFRVSVRDSEGREGKTEFKLTVK
jgi:single-stranded-DNA-specific exonuclease